MLKWAGAAAVFRYYGEVIDRSRRTATDRRRQRRDGTAGSTSVWWARRAVELPARYRGVEGGPALAAGNTVVLKPAEESPLSVLRMAELAVEAGLPPGVFNGSRPRCHRGQGTRSAPDVACLTFTGSTAVGKMFLSYSGESNMKRVWLECGGKSPNLVFADCADLDKAAEMACSESSATPVVCSANSRLLVQREIADTFVAKVVEQAAHYYPGDPLDPGHHGRSHRVRQTTRTDPELCRSRGRRDKSHWAATGSGTPGISWSPPWSRGWPPIRLW